MWGNSVNVMETPLVSVVLPTFNRASMIGASIKSVQEQSYRNLELVIINDCSSDGTYELLRDLAGFGDRIRVFHNQQRLGSPASRNKGVLHSRGSLVFFSEDDLVLDPDCISVLVDSFRCLSRKGHKVGAVGPRLITVLTGPTRTKGKEQEKCLVKISPITGFVKINFGLNIVGSVIVETLHACSLISRTAILEVGGYEPKLYKGNYSGEETDFYLRLQKKGYTLFFEPRSVVKHYFGKVGGNILPSKFSQEYYNMRNHLMYLARFYGVSTIFMFPCFLFKKLVLR